MLQKKGILNFCYLRNSTGSDSRQATSRPSDLRASLLLTGSALGVFGARDAASALPVRYRAVQPGNLKKTSVRGGSANVKNRRAGAQCTAHIKSSRSFQIDQTQMHVEIGRTIESKLI